VDQRGRIVDALAIGAKGEIDVQLPVYRLEAVSAGQRRVNGLLTVLLFAAASLVVNVRQRLRAN
jgi:apolipoprotein N-acyltransferase